MFDTQRIGEQAVFAKTATGQQEIKDRRLGLTLFLRRLLILVDGKRSAGELAPMVAGQDFLDLLQQLVNKGCIELVKVGPTDSPGKTTPVADSVEPPDTAASMLARLPAAATRTAKDIENARNFMINTINMEFGQHTRVSLIESISNCQTIDELRHLYPLWFKTMQSSRSGARALPDLVGRLFQVL